MTISTVFYDADYQRMVTNAHEDGKAIPIPVGAMFVVEWTGPVPEDEIKHKGVKHNED